MVLTKLKDIGLVLVIALLSWAVWCFFPTALNNADLIVKAEFQDLLEGRYKAVTITITELLKYLILSILFSMSVLSSSFRDQSFKPRYSWGTVILIFTLFFFTLSCYLDFHTKGLYQSTHPAASNTYDFRLVIFFILFPFLMFAVTYNVYKKVEIIAFAGFLVFGILSVYIPFKLNSDLGIIGYIYKLRRIISNGQIVFLFTFLLGLQFCFIDKEKEVI